MGTFNNFAVTAPLNLISLNLLGRDVFDFSYNYALCKSNYLLSNHPVPDHFRVSAIWNAWRLEINKSLQHSKTMMS